MASLVQICNMALSRIAVTTPIAALNERSIEAQQCSVFISHLRETVLKDFPWPFAESIASLADIGSPAPGWAFRYRYPADCLKVREIVMPGFRRALTSDMKIPFQIGYDTGGRVIHTDQPLAQVRYTFNVQDPTFFDALFTDTLAWKLAAELSIPLPAKIEFRESCEQQYARALTIAQGSAFQESGDDPEPESEFITVRS
jgi:hypothetical protein